MATSAQRRMPAIMLMAVTMYTWMRSLLLMHFLLVRVFAREPVFLDEVFLVVLVDCFFFACAINNSFIILMLIIARFWCCVNCACYGIINEWIRIQLEKSS